MWSAGCYFKKERLSSTLSPTSLKNSLDIQETDFPKILYMSSCRSIPAWLEMFHCPISWEYSYRWSVLLTFLMYSFHVVNRKHCCYPNIHSSKQKLIHMPLRSRLISHNPGSKKGYILYNFCVMVKWINDSFMWDLLSHLLHYSNMKWG